MAVAQTNHQQRNKTGRRSSSLPTLATESQALEALEKRGQVLLITNAYSLGM